MGTVLLIILILLLVGALPTWLWLGILPERPFDLGFDYSHYHGADG